MVSDSDLQQLATRAGQHLLASRRRLVTAESCTGGWIAKTITDIAGSSAWFAGGAVTYSNALKQTILQVDATLLAEHGAVSEVVVRAMAEGALKAFDGDVAVAVTGVAGPDGGTANKPVGTVWFAWSYRTTNGVDTFIDRQLFAGDRENVRRLTVAHALTRVVEK